MSFRRAYLLAFAEMSDLDILGLQLTDAQELIARQHGFPSWPALHVGANQVSNQQPKTVSQVAFLRAEPQIFVTDLARSLSFFTEKLGFEAAFAYGEPPFYAQVARGEAYVNLRVVPEPLIGPSLVHAEDYLAASICVVSIKELFLDYQSKGVEFQQTFRTEPWGAKTFIVGDPDGNLILFAE